MPTKVPNFVPKPQLSEQQMKDSMSVNVQSIEPNPTPSQVILPNHGQPQMTFRGPIMSPLYRPQFVQGQNQMVTDGRFHPPDQINQTPYQQSTPHPPVFK